MKISRLLLCQRNVKEIIRQVYEQGSLYGFVESSQRVVDKSKTVIVEYSSPNIAKPFHTGHLRSTILGNFVANLYEHLGWNVIRLNYLGDWGTQFGLLAVGFKKYGCEKELEENPLHHLFEVYVKVNADVDREKLEKNETTYTAGLNAFKKMEEVLQYRILKIEHQDYEALLYLENLFLGYGEKIALPPVIQGDPEYMKLWEKFRKISLEEYNKVYNRLGVHFTHNHFESMYAQASLDLVDRLAEEGKIETDSLGRRVMPVDARENPVVLQKSDGTGIYLTRDLAAIYDRYDKFKFDRIFYVVDDAQKRHFQNLQYIMEHLPGWKNRLNKDLHVRFGRVDGMSSRKGNVVFLSELLDKSRDLCKQTLLEKESTKVSMEEIDDISEELGRSVVIIQDFKKQRLKNYVFNWDRMLFFKQDSGVFFHYCHSRLYNLETYNEIQMDDTLDFNPDILSHNKEATKLLQEIQGIIDLSAKSSLDQHTDKLPFIEYSEGVDLAILTLEPHYIVKYTLNICHAANQAYRSCRVENADPEVAKAYLHLFRASRLVIANGMRLLGLNPLNKM